MLRENVSGLLTHGGGKLFQNTTKDFGKFIAAKSELLLVRCR